MTTNPAKISVRFVLTLHDGQLDTLRDVATRCIDTVRQKDTGTLRYDWYLSSNGKACVVLETYESSEALLAHIGNVGPLLGELMELGTGELELFGEPSDELRKAIAAFEPVIHTTLETLD
jgi:quinol monooxygenase YgiN